MPEQRMPSGASPGEEPSPQELEEILGELEFFLHMDEVDALPLEEEAEDRDDSDER